MSEVRKKVVLVDNVKFSLMMSKQKLHDIYEVHPAPSTARMFAILESIHPDVILLDISTYPVNGYEAIKKLKADAQFADIPVVFLTSKSDENSVAEYVRLGAADYIVKPFSASYLQERIETLLDPDYHQQLQEEEELLEQKTAHKPCIIAIDDVPHILRSIQYALRNRFNVQTLSKPEMLESFLQNIQVTPELFILDFNMPVINGYDIFLQIRALPEHKQTPIIFLTSEGTVDNVTAAIKLGASDFLVKPFSPAVLREKVSKQIFKEEHLN